MFEEQVEMHWCVYAEDDTTTYETEVMVLRRAYGGFSVILDESHCGKGVGCFWTGDEPVEDFYSHDFIPALNRARDIIEGARRAGAEVVYNPL